MFNPDTFRVLSDGQRATHLRIVETTDLHLHLLPYDYFADRAWDSVGLAGAAALIEEIRAEAPNSVLLDNGDFLQGTPMGDFVAQEKGLKDGDLHPVIAAMNALDYDAITLGNHEFNYGLPFLTKALARAKFPVVSANLAHHLGSAPRSDQMLVKPYTILERQIIDDRGFARPIKIGVIGFAPPQVVDWDHMALAGKVYSRDIVEAARAWIPEMREAGADLVIALAHTGIGAPRHTEGMENAAIPLARIPGIDAMLTGHSHLLFPSPVFDGMPDVDVMAGTIAGKPAVMGGCWGAHIGVIDLLLTHDGGSWQVLGTRSSVRAATERRSPAPSQAVVEAVAQAHDETLTAVRRPVGSVAAPLHSYFTHLGRTDALRIVAEAQTAHIRKNLKDPALAELPILAAIAPFKAGGRGGPGGYTDVPEGPVALRHIADLYAFPNAIAALKLTGEQIIEWLERSAAAYNQVKPGSMGTMLRNADVPGYNFEVIYPLDVTYDISQPARYDFTGKLIDPQAHRVANVLLNGEPLDLQGHYIVSTNSYRAGGAGAFAGARAENIVYQSPQVVRDMVRDYVQGSQIVTPKMLGAVRIKPLQNTQVIYETGPDAMQHLTQIAGYRPEPRGITRSGFLRLKLDLSQGV